MTLSPQLTLVLCLEPNGWSHYEAVFKRTEYAGALGGDDSELEIPPMLREQGFLALYNAKLRSSPNLTNYYSDRLGHRGILGRILILRTDGQGGRLSLTNDDEAVLRPYLKRQAAEAFAMIEAADEQKSVGQIRAEAVLHPTPEAIEEGQRIVERERELGLEADWLKPGKAWLIVDLPRPKADAYPQTVVTSPDSASPSALHGCSA
jgi:hypothetical protein